MKQLIFLLTTIISFLSFSQNPNSWVKKNDFSGFKREQAIAITIVDKAYVGTGVDTSETVLNDWWEYESGTDTWTQKANVPGAPRRCAIGFGLNNKGYVGTGVDNSEAQLGNKLFDFHEYDPATNSWTAKTNYPGNGGLGIYYSTSFIVDNKGYVCGGKTGPSAYTAEMWEYKPLIDTWVQRAYFPGGSRYNMTSVGIGINGYVGLGTNFDTYMNDWWKYEVGTNTWEQVSNFPGSYRGGACAFSVVGKGFVSCGTNGGPKKDTYEYNPTTDIWSPRADYGGSERKQAICFVIGNRAFLGTGSGTGGKKNSMYEYISLYTASIEDLEKEISVYPTVSSDKITIQFPSSYSYSKFILLDETGRIVRSEKITQASFELYKESLNAGRYTIQFISDEGMPSLKQTLIFTN